MMMKMGSLGWMVTVMIVLLVCVIRGVRGLVVHAPDKCGGAHVATHASALFGPSTHDGSLHGVRLFAPRPQEDGKYVDANATAAAEAGKGDADNGEGVAVEDQQGGSMRHLAGLRVEKAVLRRAKDTKDTELYDGCKPLSVEKDIKRAKNSVVALVRGPGSCDFERKVRNMQQVGAKGVIIVNYESQGDRLVNMKLNNMSNKDTISIPSLMVLWREWDHLAPCREQNISVSFSAEGEAAFDLDYGREALNWAMMRGMALWIFFQCGVNMVRLKRRHSELTARVDAIEALPVRTYTKRRAPVTQQSAATVAATSARQSAGLSRATRGAGTGEASASGTEEEEEDDDDHGTERTRLREQHEAAPSADNRTRAAGLAAGAGAEDDEEPLCAICIDNFEEGDQVRELECSHIYHKACIDPWLYQSSTCPVCKREIPNLPPTAGNAYGSLNV